MFTSKSLDGYLGLTPKLLGCLTFFNNKYSKNFLLVTSFFTAVKLTSAMPSKGVLEVLQIITNICYDIVSGIPFKYISQTQRFRAISTQTKHHATWFAIMLIYLFLTIFPIVESFLGKQQQNIIVLLFHGFQIIANVSAILTFIAFQNNAKEFCCLLNCLLQKPNGLVRGSSKSSLILPLVSITVVSTSIIFILFIPLISFSFPCLYASQLYTFSLGPCSSNKFRIAILFISFMFCIPIGTIVPLGIATCFVTLNEITENLKNLKFLLNRMSSSAIKVPKTTDYYVETYYKMGFCYRQMQLFAMITNQCFQMQIFQVFEIMGVTASIVLSYALITFDRVIPHFAKIGMLIILCTVLVVCSFTIDAGSRSRMLSFRVLGTAKYCSRKCGTHKWSQKFFKSCNPITMKIGTFHEMDRERVPSLIRFILQRTFFLVWKTKEGGFINHVAMSMPI